MVNQKIDETLKLYNAINKKDILSSKKHESIGYG